MNSLCISLVEMRAGRGRPNARFDSELVWMITDGDGLVRYDDRETAIGAGDTLVLPAGQMRQFVGGRNAFHETSVARGHPIITRADGGDAGTPPCVVCEIAETSQVADVWPRQGSQAEEVPNSSTEAGEEAMHSSSSHEAAKLRVDQL